MEASLNARYGTSDEFYDPYCDIPRPRDLGGAVAKPLSSKPTQSLSNVKASKKDTCNIKLRDETSSCFITGMAITKDKRILMADYKNRKVKMFSHDIKFLSSVSLLDQPRDIAVISEREAVITTSNKSLIILDTSDSQLSIKTTTPLSYNVCGISRYDNKLVVASYSISNPPSVKLIDQTGRIYWSVSSGPQFSEPLYVSSLGVGRSSTVIVTDQYSDMLTLLNGDTGEVITKRQLKTGMGPGSVTTDSAGNAYVCYGTANSVAVLSGDLSKEKTLLSWQDGLSSLPVAIAYDDATHQLIISYLNNDQVDRYQLS